MRLGDENLRGYHRSDFEDAWDHYLPAAKIVTTDGREQLGLGGV